MSGVTRIEVVDGGKVTPILIGCGVLKTELPLLLEEIAPRGGRAVVIARRVAEIWGELIRETAGPAAAWIEIDDSEANKTLENARGLLDAMFAHGIRRDWTMISVGGGVTGDLVGFVASIALRGVTLVHVPTTLLAQVDSSIGGKTGVNHASGKNLIGTFHPPAGVVSEVELLSTLEPSHLRGGLFEALKCGVISDPLLFERAGRYPHGGYDGPALQEIVIGAATVKADIVTRDPRELGERRLLNYGHTLGHALEKVLGYGELSHGDAVGWGMIAANAIGIELGVTSREVSDTIASAVFRMGPAVPRATVEVAELLEATALDKKFESTTMRVVVPRSIGHAEVVEVSVEQLRKGAEEMLRSFELP